MPTEMNTLFPIFPTASSKNFKGKSLSSTVIWNRFRSLHRHQNNPPWLFISGSHLIFKPRVKKKKKKKVLEHWMNDSESVRHVYF